MWPLILDMTKEESMQNLRNLELEAYSHLVSALRAQGPLDADKRKLLKETSTALNISQERHKAEVRRALSDEKLNTIAYHLNGQNESEDWALEGRRLVPLMPRMAPQTAFSAMADEAAEGASETNVKLPLPANTERKRPAPSVSPQNQAGVEATKPVPFRIPEPPKVEESKKRKLSIMPENSSLAQHLLGPAKTSRIQQIYRQKLKGKTKEVIKVIKPEGEVQELPAPKILPQNLILQKSPQQTGKAPSSGPKINILQNISVQGPTIIEEILDPLDSKTGEQNHVPVHTPKQISIKPSASTMFKAGNTASPGTSLKMCPTRKPITKTVNAGGQKLIVVSSAQTLPPNSILQRTLTIPFVKNISVKNFEKFKIVTTTSSTSNITTTATNTTSLNSVKHKVVTVKTNPTTKKIIPLSQLQVLNKGSIKVVPLGGKMLGKPGAISTSASSPLYIMNTTTGAVQTLTKTTTSLANAIVSARGAEPAPVAVASPSRENGKTSAGKSVIGAEAGPFLDDYDSKIDEFHIQTLKDELDTVVEEVQSENDSDVTRTNSIISTGTEEFEAIKSAILLDDEKFSFESNSSSLADNSN